MSSMDMASGVVDEDEALESPVNNLLSSVQFSPVVKVWDTDARQGIGDNVGTAEQFPSVCSTYRIVEHWQARGMSVWLPWHFNWLGLAVGASANFVTPHAGDGNSGIPEYKALLVDIRKAV
jgi:hypothetical protein